MTKRTLLGVGVRVAISGVIDVASCYVQPLPHHRAPPRQLQIRTQCFNSNSSLDLHKSISKKWSNLCCTVISALPSICKKSHTYTVPTSMCANKVEYTLISIYLQNVKQRLRKKKILCITCCCWRWLLILSCSIFEESNTSKEK